MYDVSKIFLAPAVTEKKNMSAQKCIQVSIGNENKDQRAAFRGKDE